MNLIISNKKAIFKKDEHLATPESRPLGIGSHFKLLRSRGVLGRIDISKDCG